ncbi:head-tail joining protein [Falsiroseomonas oryzae]|uniref:head-tail joining protein n=1 Tax=Falsiroseomonas oryzae TaxID=2766473 RepID=UPI0022EAEFAB|nr:hypothetical protein [Roseomonas sp. MO-31]
MSAFDAALAVLAADPNLGTDATWQRGTEPAVPLRVLCSSPDQLRDAFGTTLVQATDVLTVPVAELPDIAAGDVFSVGADILTVQHAERDAAGVAWRVLCQR